MRLAWLALAGCGVVGACAPYPAAYDPYGYGTAYTPGYAPGYVAPGYVDPGYVAPGYPVAVPPPYIEGGVGFVYEGGRYVPRPGYDPRREQFGRERFQQGRPPGPPGGPGLLPPVAGQPRPSFQPQGRPPPPPQAQPRPPGRPGQPGERRPE